MSPPPAPPPAPTQFAPKLLRSEFLIATVPFVPLTPTMPKLLFAIVTFVSVVGQAEGATDGQTAAGAAGATDRAIGDKHSGTGADEDAAATIAADRALRD